MEDQPEEEEVHERTPEPVVPPIFPLKKVQAQVPAKAPAKKVPPKISPVFEKKEPSKVSKRTAAKNKKQSEATIAAIARQKALVQKPNPADFQDILVENNNEDDDEYGPDVDVFPGRPPRNRTSIAESTTRSSVPPASASSPVDEQRENSLVQMSPVQASSLVPSVPRASPIIPSSSAQSGPPIPSDPPVPAATGSSPHIIQAPVAPVATQAPSNGRRTRSSLPPAPVPAPNSSPPPISQASVAPLTTQAPSAPVPATRQILPAVSRRRRIVPVGEPIHVHRSNTPTPPRPTGPSTMIGVAANDQENLPYINIVAPIAQPIPMAPPAGQVAPVAPMLGYAPAATGPAVTAPSAATIAPPAVTAPPVTIAPPATTAQPAPPTQPAARRVPKKGEISLDT
jgi:hypothetical protein